MPQRLQILLVEDSPADAELLLRALRQGGFEPDCVRVETESDFLERLHAGLDLVLSDYNLPRFSGLRALELLKQQGLDVPFILVSGTIGEETAVEAMKWGASDYFLKDRLWRLGPAVTQALAQARLRRERVAAEQARARAEAKYRSIFENSLEGIYQTSVEGRLLIANPALARITGYPSPEALIAAVTNVGEQIYLDRADRIRFQELMRAGGVVRGFESRIKQRDGSWRWISSDARLVRDEEGNAIYEGSLQDITERKGAEEALRASEQRFRTTLENLMEGCQIIGRDWRYLYVNEIAARHVDSTVEQVVGRSMKEVYPDLETTDLFAILQRSMEEGRPERMEHEFVQKDGAVTWFQWVIQPVPEGLFILTLDITPRKRAEEKIQGQLAELQRWHDATLGREERVLALKQEVNELLVAAGAPARYQGGLS